KVLMAPYRVGPGAEISRTAPVGAVDGGAVTLVASAAPPEPPAFHFTVNVEAARVRFARCPKAEVEAAPALSTGAGGRITKLLPSTRNDANSPIVRFVALCWTPTP